MTAVNPDRRQAVRTWIGLSGYDYKPWRGAFYPDDLPARRWLQYASRQFDSIEINGTFYSLKSPATFARWAAEVPEEGFVFAIKGSRFITHNLKLRNCDTAMANFFASGILLLGHMTGPFLWQLPATYSFDPDRMRSFMRSLPRSSGAAESIALRHDERLKRGACTRATVDVPYRHAFEVRHESYFSEDFYAILREEQCALVIADTGGRFPYAEEITADFVYVRLHGPRELYASSYTDSELRAWARRIRTFQTASGQPHDVYVYFDNDVKAFAPADARRLIRVCRRGAMIAS
ncbi:MAG TPA: DUF72 domain-containing protein [Gemmatimonadaceae bacterium]|nr:DUF72 domain-containing protein [Gemmatimonadaceae bacterium]